MWPSDQKPSVGCSGDHPNFMSCRLANHGPLGTIKSCSHLQSARGFLRISHWLKDIKNQKNSKDHFWGAIQVQSFCQQLWRSHPAHLISLDMKVTSILSTASQQKGKVFRFATARKLSEDSEVKCNWKYCNAPGCRSIFLGVPAARLSFSTEATTWQQIDQCTNCTEDVYMDKDSRSRVAQSLTFSKILFDKIDNIIGHLYPRIRFTCVV